MLRANPPGEDATHGARALPVSINAAGTPPGEDGMTRDGSNGVADELENTAARQTVGDMTGDRETERDFVPDIDFLGLVVRAEAEAQTYQTQVNRKAWSQSLRAFHNQHHVGSKYTRPEWRGRAALFVPKTRTAVRKDQASVAASLFNNIDAINCLPGNEGDPRQRAAAAVMEELVNYRTDRASGKAAIPWFTIAMGARQDALLTGICLSKQAWKMEYRQDADEQVEGADGVQVSREVYKVATDKPDIWLFPPENFVIDSAADWTNPAQSAGFLILKYPMHIDEIRGKQNAPVNPWNEVSEDILRASVQAGTIDTEAIRRAREDGLDRLNKAQSGTEFQIVWVYESFIRIGGEDWTFYSIGGRAFLTDPRPTREVYPEQFGERPVALGYGSLEAHRIFPMSPVESWQMLQLETNEIRNLLLDAVKQNVMPVTKVKRGKQIDLEQVRRRSSGSAIIVQDQEDVTWEHPPDISQGPIEMSRELALEFDDLAGQQNYGSVETNNALGKTLGGLKLAAGAANAVQEFDIRVWLETWVAPVMAQIVRLEQYYESDATVLGLCGQRAGLFEKYGVNRIDDDLLEQEITVRVSVGLGAGDPQQRLAKFQSAASIVAPILQQSPEFQSGEMEINVEAIIEEVFGAVGYHDAGSRFFKKNQQPRPNPKGDLETRKLEAEIAKNDRLGKASLMSGLAAVAKVALGKRELEANVVDSLLDHQHRARDMGFDHGHRQNDQRLSATDHGHRHGLAIANHRRQVQQDMMNAARDAAGDDQDGEAQGGAAEMEGSPAPASAPSQAGPSGPPSAAPPPHDEMMQQLLRNGSLKFTRGRDGRIDGLALNGAGGEDARSYGQRLDRLAQPSPPQDTAPPPSKAPQKPQEPQERKPAPAADHHEERFQRLEALVERLAKPRHRRIVRDANNRIVRVEDAEAAS